MAENLRPSKSELRIARNAVEKMKMARSFDEFEEEWKTYLGALEKSWIKAEQSCRGISTKFQPWQGMFIGQRKKDPLLRYLKQARNCDTHTIRELLEHLPASFGFGIEGPGPVYIKHLEISQSGTQYEGSHLPKITILPERVQLIVIENLSKRYNPPTIHNDAPLERNDPIAVAELGIAYYEKYIQELERKFFNT